MNEPSRNILSSGALQLGITLSDQQLEQFEMFTSLLLEWNRRFNLTRITDPEEIAVKHYLDSIALLTVLDIPSGSEMIDVGTGAGFPAVPLKIARPDLRMTMLDSVRKRLSFLEEAVDELDLLDAELVHGRAENIGREKFFRERFDFAVSRAVARLNVLTELCLPFCRVRGKFVAYKGPEAGEEIDEASRSIHILGGELEAVRGLTLPRSEISRTLVIIRKLRSTPPKYPRRAGVPERSPL